MTATMSSEGDSSKSVLSEANEKSGTDNNTDDSSQDSQDANEIKAASENNVKKNEDDKPQVEEESVDEKPVEKKDVRDINDEPDKKVQSEEEIESEETEKTSDKPEKIEKGEREKKEKKSTKKEENEKDENSAKEDEGSDKDGEKDVPLLDQPLQKSGKRERKSVQRFNEDTPVDAKEGKFELIEGHGVALGDIPRVDASISRFKNDDLKPLHRLLFKVSGKSTLIKKNIRKFNGFDFEKDTEDYNKKIAASLKFELKQLKSICEMLDLQKSGTKDEVVHRVLEFLLDPKDSGKPVEGGRPKRTAAVKANNRGYSSHDDYSSDEKQSSRARRDKGKRANLKDETSSDEEFRPNQSDASEDKPRSNHRKRKTPKKRGSSEEDEASEASIASSDESDDEPKSKRKRSPVKANNKSKTPAKKTTGKRGRPPVSATPAKKVVKRGKKSKTASSDEEDESDHKDNADSSSEDEPLVKKAKNSQPPTDDEIKTFIKNILEGANLEEITMKTVCQRVYGHYPDFDLTHKKDFIKSTVKSLIST